MHLKKYCKEKKKMEIEKEKIKLNCQNIKLKEELKQVKNNIQNNTQKNIINTNNITNNNNTNNTNNTNNITNNITNNNLTLQIQINAFGKEDLSHITLEDYKKCLEQRFPGLFKYIRLVHLNKDVPQNHNILITNGKSKFIKVYKDGKFRTEYKDDIIADILNNNLGRLEDKANELEGKISNKIMDNHRKFQEVYYKNNKKLIKKNMEIVENMFLDDKDIIENTHNNKQITNK